MKTASLFPLVLLAACASAPKPAPEAATTQTTAAAPAAETEQKSALETWAEAKVKKEEASMPKAKTDALDPLAMNDEGEASLLPKIEATPAKELRPKTRADLQAGLAVVKSATSVDDAAKKLTARLGKPTWTENGAKRIWVARDGATCHRLVLDADGSLEVESASVKEQRQLTATARQNVCTGQIERGVSK